MDKSDIAGITQQKPKAVRKSTAAKRQEKAAAVTTVVVTAPVAVQKPVETVTSVVEEAVEKSQSTLLAPVKKPPRKKTPVAMNNSPVAADTVAQQAPASAPVVSKKKAVKRKPTQESIELAFDLAIKKLSEEMNDADVKKTELGKKLKQQKKELEVLKKDVANYTKPKKEKNSEKKVTSGFGIAKRISDELADFIMVPRGERLSRLDATRAICTYVNLKPDETRQESIRWSKLNPEGKRDLRDPKLKKNIIPDEKLSKLLRYDEYVRQIKAGEIKREVKDKVTGAVTVTTVTDPSLYYCTIQRLIGVHLLSDETTE